MLNCIHDFYRDAMGCRVAHRMCLVAGPDIERAFLKMLLVSIAGGWLRDGATTANPSDLPENIAAAIWGNCPFDGGMYAVDVRDPERWGPDDHILTWTEPWKENGVIAGCGFKLAGIPMAISFFPLTQCGFGLAPYLKAYRRPMRIVVFHRDAELTIEMTWPSGWATDGKVLRRRSIINDNTTHSD